MSRILGTGFNGYEVVESEASGKGTMGQASIELKRSSWGTALPNGYDLYTWKNNRLSREKENNRLDNGDWGQKDWGTMGVRTMGKMGTVTTAIKNKTRKEKETTRIVTLPPLYTEDTLS